MANGRRKKIKVAIAVELLLIVTDAPWAPKCVTLINIRGACHLIRCECSYLLVYNVSMSFWQQRHVCGLRTPKKLSHPLLIS